MGVKFNETLSPLQGIYTPRYSAGIACLEYISEALLVNKRNNYCSSKKEFYVIIFKLLLSNLWFQCNIHCPLGNTAEPKVTANLVSVSLKSPTFDNKIVIPWWGCEGFCDWFPLGWRGLGVKWVHWWFFSSSYYVYNYLLKFPCTYSTMYCKDNWNSLWNISLVARVNSLSLFMKCFPNLSYVLDLILVSWNNNYSRNKSYLILVQFYCMTTVTSHKLIQEKLILGPGCSKAD